MNIEALHEMIRLLKTVPNTKFCLGNWYCGSYACAIGHATKDQWFIDKGFIQGGDKLICPERYMPVYVSDSRFENWAAVQNFFGLTYGQATYLFSSDYYPKGNFTSPKMVIDRIENFLTMDFKSYKFIKQQGLNEVLKIVDNAPAWAVGWNPHAKEYTTWFMKCNGDIYFDDLKPAIADYKLVGEHGGLIHAECELKKIDSDWDYHSPRYLALKSAIERIKLGEMI